MRLMKLGLAAVLLLAAPGCASEADDEETTESSADELGLQLSVNTSGFFVEVEAPREAAASLLPPELTIDEGETAKLLLYVVRYRFPFKSVAEATILVPDARFKKAHGCESATGERFYYFARTFLDSTLFEAAYVPYTKHLSTARMKLDDSGATLLREGEAWTLTAGARTTIPNAQPIDTTRKILGQLPTNLWATHTLEFDVTKTEEVSGSFTITGSSHDIPPTADPRITWVESKGKLSAPSICY